jgi:transposase
MKIEHIDIEATIEKARQLVSDDTQLSAASKSMFEIMLLVITLLANRLNLISTNSIKPPSSDPNRKKKPKSKTGNKPGGQKGHVGTTLKKVDDPDKIKVIKVDRSKPPSGQYRQVGFKSRQVFDIDISGVVTEYRAQIFEDANGRPFVASFPEKVIKAAQ